jgi:hypothetical protein
MNMREKSSAYEVWSILKGRGITMAYKNVYTRIKILEKRDLIERAGKSKYGAINYRLTTQGLFYQVSRFVNIDDTLGWSDFLDFYSENIIFKALVLPYFEKDTIKKANVTLYFTIVSYLRDCYQITLNGADNIRKAIKDHNKEHTEYYTKRLKEDLEWQPRIFAFELVTGFLKKEGGRYVVGLLARDRKFVKLLREVQKDFAKGFTVVDNIHSRL